MIIFKNPGVFDLSGAKTFGLTTKDETQRGRFGTGCKYAFAVICALGGEITILTDGKKHIISGAEETFREKTFTRVMLDDEPLAYTTELGRDWEPWMAFRELYANALDEGGSLERVEEIPESVEGTVICVDLNQFEAIYFSIEEHFIADETPIWKNDGLEIYQGKSAFVFYRGFAVMKLRTPAAFRYNILSYITLTEDRTARYDFQVKAAIALGATACEDYDIARAITDQSNEFEAKLDFVDDGGDPVDAFIGAAASNGTNCNPTAAALVAAKAPNDPNLASIMVPGTPGVDELNGALRVLRQLLEDFTDVKWVLAPDVPMSKEYLVRDNAIFISDRVFNDAKEMKKAVLEGYSELRGNSWSTRKLMQIADVLIKDDSI